MIEQSSSFCGVQRADDLITSLVVDIDGAIESRIVSPLLFPCVRRAQR